MALIDLDYKRLFTNPLLQPSISHITCPRSRCRCRCCCRLCLRCTGLFTAFAFQKVEPLADVPLIHIGHGKGSNGGGGGSGGDNERGSAALKATKYQTLTHDINSNNDTSNNNNINDINRMTHTKQTHALVAPLESHVCLRCGDFPRMCL